MQLTKFLIGTAVALATVTSPVAAKKKDKEAAWALHLSKQTLFVLFLKWSFIDLQQLLSLTPPVALHFGGRSCFLAFEKTFLAFVITVLMLLLLLLKGLRIYMQMMNLHPLHLVMFLASHYLSVSI
jgi:hypothetical protein